MANGSSWREFRRGLKYLHPHRLTIPVVLAFALGSSALGAVEPLVHGSIFRRLSGLTRHDSPAPFLSGPILLLLAIVVVRQLSEAAATVLSWRVRLRINRALLSDA